jgi:ABC-type Fe3+-siderophore transport system permease subunit
VVTSDDGQNVRRQIRAGKRTAEETLVDSTALLTAIMGAAYGAMVVYRLAKGQRWMATAVAAIGSVILANLVTLGNRSRLEPHVILIASVALTILFLAASGAAQKERERDLGDKRSDG